MTIEQLRYLKKALAFVFSLVEPDEYIGKCPEADYEAINGLIEGEIERVSVTDEDVQKAIKKMSEYFVFEELYRDDWIKAVRLAIEALKAYRPVRENRTTEPVGGQPGIRQKQCDWCENPRMMDGWISVEGRGASMYIDEFRYCPNCGREL